MDSKNLFFGLGSILIIIIILSVLGVLEPTQSISKPNTKEVIIQQTPPVYYGGGYRKNIVYAPDVYTRPRFYGRRGRRNGYYY